MDREKVRVTNNEAESRFEATIDGHVGFLQYRNVNGLMSLIHTEVPAELEGRGVAGELVRTGLEYARSQSLKVAPLCSFVAGYIKRHPEYMDVLSEKYKTNLQQ
jgi:predicted GNAT family acetyltransferase